MRWRVAWRYPDGSAEPMSDPCDTREEAEAELDVVATYDRLSTGPVPSGEWVVEELEEGS